MLFFMDKQAVDRKKKITIRTTLQVFRTYFVNGDIINNWRLLQNVYHTVEGWSRKSESWLYCAYTLQKYRNLFFPRHLIFFSRSDTRTSPSLDNRGLFPYQEINTICNAFHASRKSMHNWARLLETFHIESSSFETTSNLFAFFPLNRELPRSLALPSFVLCSLTGLRSTVQLQTPMDAPCSIVIEH